MSTTTNVQKVSYESNRALRSWVRMSHHHQKKQSPHTSRPGTNPACRRTRKKAQFQLRIAPVAETRPRSAPHYSTNVHNHKRPTSFVRIQQSVTELGPDVSPPPKKAYSAQQLISTACSSNHSNGPPLNPAPQHRCPQPQTSKNFKKF